MIALFTEWVFYIGRKSKFNDTTGSTEKDCSSLDFIAMKSLIEGWHKKEIQRKQSMSSG